MLCSSHTCLTRSNLCDILCSSRCCNKTRLIIRKWSIWWTCYQSTRWNHRLSTTLHHPKSVDDGGNEQNAQNDEERHSFQSHFFPAKKTCNVSISLGLTYQLYHWLPWKQSTVTCYRRRLKTCSRGARVVDSMAPHSLDSSNKSCEILMERFYFQVKSLKFQLFSLCKWSPKLDLFLSLK